MLPHVGQAAEQGTPVRRYVYVDEDASQERGTTTITARLLGSSCRLDLLTAAWELGAMSLTSDEDLCGLSGLAGSWTLLSTCP